MIADMAEIEWTREEVRTRLSKLKKRYEYKEIADATGVARDSIAQFASTGHLGAANFRKLAAWVALKTGDIDHIVRDDVVRYARPLSSVIAAELRSHALAFESDNFTGDAKAKRFDGMIKWFLDNRDDYVEALRDESMER